MNRTPHFIQMPLIFLQCPNFCVPRSYQDSIFIQSLCLLCLLWYVTFPQSFLVLDDLDSFQEYWSGILQTVSQICFSEVFLMARLRYLFLGTKRTGVKCHHHISWMYAINMTYTTNDVNLDHLRRQCLPFLHGKGVHHTPVFEVSHLCATHIQVWRLGWGQGGWLSCTSHRGKPLHKFKCNSKAQKIVTSSSFIFLVTSLWTH